MNTPAHVIVNLAVLGRKESVKTQAAILIGALLPDAPMFFFYFIQKVVLRVPEYQIWVHEYYRESWQNFFDCFNSLPFMAVGLLVAWRVQSQAGQLFCLSMLLHVCGDLPLHHDDGHRHFFPFSDWRFESPVSYWDPLHYGHIVSGLEVLVVLIAGLIVFRYSTSPVTKSIVGTVGVSYAVYFGYAVWVWM